jgi:hypothetical protein
MLDYDETNMSVSGYFTFLFGFILDTWFDGLFLITFWIKLSGFVDY